MILLTDKTLKLASSFAVIFIGAALYGNWIRSDMNAYQGILLLGVQLYALFSGFYHLGKKITHSGEGGFLTVLFTFIFPVWALNPYLLAEQQSLYGFNNLLFGFCVILNVLAFFPYFVARIVTLFLLLLSFGYEAYQIHALWPAMPHSMSNLNSILSINPFLSDFWQWNFAAVIAFFVAIALGVKQSGLRLSRMEKEAILIGFIGVSVHVLGLLENAPIILLLAPGRLLVITLAVLLPRVTQLFLACINQGLPIYCLIGILMVALSFPNMPMGFEGSAFCLLLLAVLNQISIEAKQTLKPIFKIGLPLILIMVPLVQLLHFDAPWLYSKEQSKRDVVAWVRSHALKWGKPIKLASLSQNMPYQSALYLGWDKILPPFKDIESTFNRQDVLMRFLNLKDKTLTADDKNQILRNATALLGRKGIGQMMALVEVDYLILPRSRNKESAYQNDDYEVWVKSDDKK